MSLTTPNCSQFENSSFSCSSSHPLGIRIGLYMFFTCSITITVFGNLGIIISISHFVQLHSPTNYLILSLAITDLCLGIFIMPYSMVRTVENCWYFGNIFCKIHYGFDLTLSVISIFHLCIIAIDRFYAVCQPLYYPIRITGPVIKRLVFLCWSIAMIFSLGVVVSNSHVSGLEGYDILVTCFHVCPITFNKLWSLVLFFICFFIPASIMVGIYIKIFLVSLKHRRNIKRNILAETSQSIFKKREHQAAKKLAILMGVFLTCWLPLFVTFLVDPFINYSTPTVIFEVFNWFSYINSTCNPILYGFLYPWFRKALRHIACGRIFYGRSPKKSVFR
ncbi:trace amine-associated receptor 2-like [Hyla sarda]|uniref:trace amine-associated receptor 2-like n=1 Tax=Hyla sarda TaxID=327740 RepID=UPI0024C3D3B5|nr:trace amine-associated receptor 2-like [Hyla sarda]